MKAELLFHEKNLDEFGNIVEMKVWRVPKAQHAPYGYKYSFVYVVMGRRVIGYDNERGKGDHRHFEKTETLYAFSGVEVLVADFLRDVTRYREKLHESQRSKNRH